VGTGGRAILAAGLVLLNAAASQAAPKTDVVVLRNGDRITGEIEELDRGRLTLKTDDIGTLAIEWDNVRSLTATATFEVDDLQGGQYFGGLQPGPGETQLAIVSIGATQVLELAQIDSIHRIGATFWQRLDGSLNVGASYTSSSDLLKIDLAARFVFTRPGHRFGVEENSTITRQPDVDETRRNELALTYERRLANRWVAFGLTRFEQNRELGFDLRSSIAAGAGRYLVQGRRNELLAGFGLNVGREKPLEGDSTTNTEATLGFRLDRFSYDFPRVDVYVSLVGFASLSDWGRERVELQARLSREIVSDFTVNLNGYESYDSRPPTEGVKHHDYGVSFGLGWTF
jgi:hypothetical protein